MMGDSAASADPMEKLVDAKLAAMEAFGAEKVEETAKAADGLRRKFAFEQLVDDYHKKRCPHMSKEEARQNVRDAVIPDGAGGLEGMAIRKRCAQCFKLGATKRCGKCKKAFYCSADCQRKGP